MGGRQSRDDLDHSDTDADADTDTCTDDSELEREEDESPSPAIAASNHGIPAETLSPAPSASLDAVDEKLNSLKIKYFKTPFPSPSSPIPPPNLHLNLNLNNTVKLYLHVGGSSPSAHWIISEKLAPCIFFKPPSSANDSNPDDGSDDVDNYEEENRDSASPSWFLKIGSKVQVRVGPEMLLKSFPDQGRVDFVADGVWAVKFSSPEAYKNFQKEYHRCSFENAYGFEANEENKVKVFGKDFMAWAQPDSADDSIWEDANSESFEKSPIDTTPPANKIHSLLEEFEEAADEGGIQSLALGALENSFLVGHSGIQVLRNFSHGVHGKGLSVKYSGNGSSHSTHKKVLLMRAETNMLLMNPANPETIHAGGVHQLDIETGKVVTEWKFGKDGTSITMRDIANDSKGAQLDPSESTFLGLDDNRLCRWDMRERRGMVQTIGNSMESPVLHWEQGHQFSRGTNFQTFASTGDGSIVVGSLDGRIRLYSKSSMRMAKTAFPGLGSPITHVDVTFDGKWILGTTDTYLVLICTVFKDKDGKEKNGFSGRMGNRVAAPRLLKLTPLDSHLAGINRFQRGQFSWVLNPPHDEIGYLSHESHLGNILFANILHYGPLLIQVYPKFFETLSKS
ncbi:Protein CYPRO4 [Platanthera zijinensis]|uniref:Protein CYPRO4 n=1 Tax=Platanthera zijinensis TaxID=2320716 RepID=A0AAP0AYC2_9ASPA